MVQTLHGHLAIHPIADQKAIEMKVNKGFSVIKQSNTLVESTVVFSYNNNEVYLAPGDKVYFKEDVLKHVEFLKVYDQFGVQYSLVPFSLVVGYSNK